MFTGSSTCSLVSNDTQGFVICRHIGDWEVEESWMQG